ncbi:MAG: tRNA preQ1(34) S-adenosylmethionine ribosyltransferase-isomerase QueA [Nitrospirota bacterium]
MKVADFDFILSKDLIAKRPLKERDSSRLLVLFRDGMIEHKSFSDLPSYLEKGDMLLINNTKVFPARLTGFKQNGERIEILLIRKKECNVWEVLSKGGFTGTITISDNLQLELHNGSTARFKYSGDFMDIIWQQGNMPLPPYIKRLPDEADKESYQTVFAREEGSIAAPTAGIHFTDRLLNEIALKGILIRELTLHVGPGTFKPIRTENLNDHSMEAEFFEIDKGIISEIREIKASCRRIISVGTTTTRAIEGCMSGRYTNNSNPPSPPFLKGGKGGLQSSKFISGATDIFIYPGYEFRVVDSLVTNFHLPGSTPLMLASAMCGWKKLIKAYKEAIAREYRFLSYGDAMLIL